MKLTLSKIIAANVIIWLFGFWMKYQGMNIDFFIIALGSILTTFLMYKLTGQEK